MPEENFDTEDKCKQFCLDTPGCRAVDYNVVSVKPEWTTKSNDSGEGKSPWFPDQQPEVVLSVSGHKAMLPTSCQRRDPGVALGRRRGDSLQENILWVFSTPSVMYKSNNPIPWSMCSSLSLWSERVSLSEWVLHVLCEIITILRHTLSNSGDKRCYQHAAFTVSNTDPSLQQFQSLVLNDLPAQLMGDGLSLVTCPNNCFFRQDIAEVAGETRYSCRVRKGTGSQSVVVCAGI